MQRLFSGCKVLGIEFDAEIVSVEDLRCQESLTRTTKGIKHQIVLPGEGFDQRFQRCHRLLGGMELVARVGHVADIGDRILRQSWITLRQQISLLVLVPEEARFRCVLLVRCSARVRREDTRKVGLRGNRRVKVFAVVAITSKRLIKLGFSLNKASVWVVLVRFIFYGCHKFRQVSFLAT